MQCQRCLDITAIAVEQGTVVEQHRQVRVSIRIQRQHGFLRACVQGIGARQVFQAVRGMGQIGQDVGAVVVRRIRMCIEPGLATAQPCICLRIVLAHQVEVAEVAQRIAVQQVVGQLVALEPGDRVAEAGLGFLHAALFLAQEGGRLAHAQGADVVLAEGRAAVRQRARQLCIGLLQPVAAEHAVADAESDFGRQLGSAMEAFVDACPPPRPVLR